MKTYKAFFMYEAKRFLCKRNSIIIAMLLLTSLLFIQLGINDYNNLLDRKEKFQEIEKQKVSKYINYRLYGVYGIKILYVPDTISIFFYNSCVIPEMTAYADSGERLKIYLPLKGKNIFDLRKNGMADFSGILLFFGSLLALIYGYDGIRKDEYMRFLSSLLNKKKVFVFIMISRVLLLYLLILAIMASALLLMVINGFPIPFDKHLLYFLLMIFLITLFFFILGTIFSTVQSKIIGITSMLSCWFFLLFIVPTIMNSFISGKSGHIKPIYKLEMETFKIFSDFEKKVIKKAVTYKYGEKITKAVKDAVLSYWNNEFKKILSLEEDMRNQMKKNISFLKRISILFPSTFYISVNNEISSRGYYNLIEFYRYVLKIKKRFVKFYIVKLYFSNFSKVENFIKKSENIFHSQSQLPEYFELGILIKLIYIGGLLILSYSRFKKNLYAQPIKEMKQGNIPELNLKQGELKTWGIEGNFFKSQLYTLLSGETTVLEKKQTQIKVTINNDTISTQGRKQDFLYLCHPCEIPGDIKANDLLVLMKNLFKSKRDKTNEPASGLTGSAFFGKKFKNMTKHELGQFTLEVLNIIKCSVYLIHDIAWGMTEDFGVRLKDRMEELRDSGALVLFLTSDIFFLSRTSEPRRCFYESDAWAKVVDSLNRVKTLK
jgi:ABC-type transport system involved in multi-copper enzyme maturation permease subunit